MTPIETQSALLVPYISKYAITTKPQTKTWKTGKHYTNCGQDDHNMETCRVNKKEVPIVETKEATIQLEKG
jgi:hypothetical protein